jgi:hypothetical protein
VVIVFGVHPKGSEIRAAGVAALAPVCVTLSATNPNKIQFLVGHVSVQTTERYIGCNQKLRIAVNHRIGIEPE